MDERAAVALPVDHGDAAVAGPEALPARGARAAHGADHLADEPRVGEHEHPPAQMGRGDAPRGPGAARAEIAIALAPRPAEVLVVLAKVRLPQRGVAPL